MVYRRPTTTHRRIREEKEEGAEKIFGGDGYDVYKISTRDASIKYGTYTKWCISNPTDSYSFDGYKNDGGVKDFYFIIPQNSQIGKLCYVYYGLNGINYFCDYHNVDHKVEEIIPTLPSSVINSLPGLTSFKESYRRRNRRMVEEDKNEFITPNYMTNENINRFMKNAGKRLTKLITSYRDDLTIDGFEEESRLLDYEINDALQAQLEGILLIRDRMYIKTTDSDEAIRHFDKLLKDNTAEMEREILKTANRSFGSGHFTSVKLDIKPDQLNVFPGFGDGGRQYIFDNIVFVTLN